MIPIEHLIARAVPGRVVVPGATNNEGWDNLVRFAQVDGIEWVFRMPRRAAVEPELNRERRILDLVRARLPVAVPDWQVDTTIDGRRIIGYPRLPGRPAGIDAPAGDGFTFSLPIPPPQRFIDTLGATLAALHSIPSAETVAAIGTPVSDRKPLQDRLQFLTQTLPIRPELQAWWDDMLADDRLWPTDLRLCHADVHPAHTLVATDHAVVGIIDWTDAGWGDPALDFVDTRAAYGAEVTARLLTAYGQAGGVVSEPRIVVRQALQVTMAAKFGLDTGRDDILVLARRRLDEQADRLARGEPPV